MKKIATLLFIPAFIFGMLASCGGGGKEYAEESDEAEATEETAEEEAITYSKETVVGVVHSVEDLAKWVEVYEEVSEPAARLSYYVNVDNPSEIAVFEFTTSHEEAEAAFSSDEMKADMESAGVSSEPMISYMDVKYINEESTDATYRVFISHEVTDFEAWKVIFDGDEARRAEAGLELRGLGTDADNPNLVSMFFATNDLEAVKGMLADPELKTTMDDAGVISEPVASFWQLPNAY